MGCRRCGGVAVRSIAAELADWWVVAVRVVVVFGTWRGGVLEREAGQGSAAGCTGAVVCGLCVEGQGRWGGALQGRWMGIEMSDLNGVEQIRESSVWLRSGVSELFRESECV